ncbi:MAG: RNB domain-containing ribonuclease [Chloroflexota bacterium]
MAEPGVGALVLYKNQPALIRKIGRKLDILLPDGQTVSVRPKDINLLHPGPLTSLANLAPRNGEPLVAWELLQGETFSLETLSDLIYGEYTPSTAWAAWQLVEDGLLFRGSPEAIEANDAATRNAIHAKREARAAEEAAWSAFQSHIAAAEIMPEDGRYWAEIEAVALGQSDRSRALELLGLSQSPEAAHELLLKASYWNEMVNPYPARAGVITTHPETELPDLPDEPRLDLTHLTALAIDDEGSTDPDDAISYDDGWLWVHVADAAALVPPDSEADLEARSRAANLYLPEGTIPMLPREATERLGLGLEETSPALSFAVRLEDDGRIGDLRIEPSWVRVTRLSYEEAQTRLDSKPLSSLAALSDRLRDRRIARNSVEIDLPEVRVRVEENGEVTIRPLPSLRSRDVVREAMLVIGEAVAQYAGTHDIPLPYSAQDAPYEFDLALVGPAGMFARRRAMQRSRQQTTPAPHSGLGLEQYVQATSPLRRYLDLVVHQQLRAHLRGEPVLDSSEILLRIGSVGDQAMAVRTAERLSISHWTCVYLLQHSDWQGEGIIVEDRNSQFTILIPELGTEAHQRLKKGAALNAPVNLKVTSVNLPLREASFRVSL